MTDLHDGLHVRLVFSSTGDKGHRAAQARLLQRFGKPSISTDDRDTHLSQALLRRRARRVVDGDNVQIHLDEVSDHSLAHMPSAEYDDMIPVGQRQSLRPRVSIVVPVEHQGQEVGRAESGQQHKAHGHDVPKHHQGSLRRHGLRSLQNHELQNYIRAVDQGHRAPPHRLVHLAVNESAHKNKKKESDQWNAELPEQPHSVVPGGRYGPREKPREKSTEKSTDGTFYWECEAASYGRGQTSSSIGSV